VIEIVWRSDRPASAVGANPVVANPLVAGEPRLRRMQSRARSYDSCVIDIRYYFPEWRLAALRPLGDHSQQVRARIALLSRELHQLRNLAAKLALRRRPDNTDTASGAHLEQALVA
jgi:hypothetical protein